MGADSRATPQIRESVRPWCRRRRCGVPALGAIERIGSICGDAVALATQPNFVNALHTQRRKCAKADVQGYARYFSTPRAAMRSSISVVKCRLLPWAPLPHPGSRENTSPVTFAVGGCILLVNIGEAAARDRCDRARRESLDGRKFKQTIAKLSSLKDLGSKHDFAIGRGRTSRSPIATFRPGRTRACQRLPPRAR